jgi:hypothetical protein
MELVGEIDPKNMSAHPASFKDESNEGLAFRKSRHRTEDEDDKILSVDNVM